MGLLAADESSMAADESSGAAAAASVADDEPARQACRTPRRVLVSHTAPEAFAPATRPILAKLG